MDRLKLIAFDEVDLGIISAHTQDAVLKTESLKFQSAGQRFIMELNRFVWEKADAGSAPNSFERRKAILHFERVQSVQAFALNQKDQNAVLDLLAIRFFPSADSNKDNADPSGTVEIAFAGGATLRLLVECIEAQLTDMAASWETTSRPVHEDDNDAG